MPVKKSSGLGRSGLRILRWRAGKSGHGRAHYPSLVLANIPLLKYLLCNICDKEFDNCYSSQALFPFPRHMYESSDIDNNYFRVETVISVTA